MIELGKNSNDKSYTELWYKYCNLKELFRTSVEYIWHYTTFKFVEIRFTYVLEFSKNNK